MPFLRPWPPLPPPGDNRIVNRLLGALGAPVTYRRWAGLILGGALLMPYMMAGQVVSALWRPGQPQGDPLLATQPIVFVSVLPLIAVTGLFLPVRAFETAAARTLLGVSVETPPARRRRTWSERWRTTTWFTLHLAVGGVMSGLTLALPPFAVWLAVLPFTGGRWTLADSRLLPDWDRGWGPPLALAVMAGLLAAVVAAGTLLARLAPALLGPSPADRLALAEERSRRLAARNRLARELHDSVGHALSVVTVQAVAAGRVLDRDPEAARNALGAIEASARNALEELDHLIGVLRDGDDHGGVRRRGTERKGPEPTLDDLGALLDASGATVISREAYRVVQEALTNAIRHGTGPVTVRVAVQERGLEVEVANPAGSATGRAGRGLDGMRERVTLLGGGFQAGLSRKGGEWRVRARIPLPGGETGEIQGGEIEAGGRR